MEIKFWEDRNKKIIEKNLYSKVADDIANKVYEDYQSSRSKKNNISQIRKFYDEVLRFDSILKSFPEEKRNEEFKKILPYLNMLNSKAAYAEARELVSEKFRNFIKAGLSNIHEKSDFDVFVGLFEAFMGFYKYYVEVESKRERNNNRNR